VILFAAFALIALSVPICGGRLRRLGALRLAAVWTVVVALAVQVLIISVLPRSLPGAVADALHLASYALAFAFFRANRRVPWLWVIGIGGASNFVAIGANDGVMPASATAMAAAGRHPAAHGFANSAARPHEHLRFLGDIFSVPHSWPLANVFSPGDVLLVVGGALWLHTLCGSRLRLGRISSGETLDDTGDGARWDRHPGRAVGRFVVELVERLVELVGRHDEGAVGRGREEVADPGRSGVPIEERGPVVGLPRHGPVHRGVVDGGLAQGETGGVVERAQHARHVLER
jgi:hypothetical protein